MYRGSRPHRGGYRHPPPSRGFGPRPGPGHPPDRGHHPPPDPYRRPSPRRRYSSPGERDPPDEYRGGRPPRAYGRYSPSPPRGGLPIDHSLVITVGNELTNPSAYTGKDATYVRDYAAGESHHNKPYYSPRRSSFDEQSDRGSRRRSVSRGRSRGRSRSPGYGRSKSRPRSRSRSRSYSRNRSRERSPERAKSRARSKSRPRGRSYSRSRSRSRSGSRSRKQSRARSRARSKSRPRSHSRERSRSRGRSRGRSRVRSRSFSCSGSSSSSASSRSRHSSVNRRVKSGKFRNKEDFSELEKARRRKEIQDMLIQPAKSILKKRVDSSETDSPMLVQNSDSPRVNPDGGLSHEAEQLLCALSKTMDPDVLASMLGKSSDGHIFEELIGKIQPAREGGSDLLLPHEKGRPEKSDLTEFLGMIAEVAQPQNVKKSLTDIEDEEKFLYGDEEEEGDVLKSAKEIATDSSFPDTREHGTASYAFSHTGENVTSHSKRDSRQTDRHRSSTTPEVHAKEESNDFPPGVGPQDVKVRKEVEEYEKIQDLLKTIGLDLGVAEISKMAARTQARLHGNASVKKTPAHRQSERKHRSRSRSYSSSSGSRSSSRSGSSSRSRSRSRSRRSRSSSLGRKSSRSRKKPVSPEQRSPRSHSQSKKETKPGIPESGWPTTPTVGPGTPTYPSQPGLSAHPMPTYPGPPPRGVMPPDYPPRGYDPYSNYVPYMPPGWPMYPPPSMPVPPPSQVDPYSLPNMDRPFLKVIKTVTSDGKTHDKKAPSKLDAVTSTTITSGIQRKEIEDRNTASQKQKVVEELEKLKKEKEVRQKRKENLLKDVETLRKQQGELLRKKRREKDGHKDPLLVELGQLQEDAMAQISKLRVEQREADQKHEELVKVALILGIDYKEPKICGDHGQQPPHSKKESARSPEKSVDKTSPSYKKVASSKSRASPEKPKTSPPLSSQSLDTASEQFEYYDAGNHWCKNCNVTSGSMFDYFMHLHSKPHRKTLDPYDRPWAKSENAKKHPAGKRTSKPAKGSEFLLPVRGFFCQLCEEFFGDPICAEAHVTCHAHNERYKAKIYENPLYEQRRNLDRQAGLESQKSSELKRKREDDDQDETKKSKHGKEGKMTSNATETKAQYSKEEQYKNIKENENKHKEKYKKEDMDKQKCKEDDERAKIKKEQEERARYKKDDERNRFKKDEEYMYKYRKEEGERSRYEEDRFRNRDDEECYRYKEEDDSYKFRKDDNRGRYGRDEEKLKYGNEEDKRYKYAREPEERSKYKDEDWGKWPKSKWDDDQESNGKFEKKDDKTKHQKVKAGHFKDESTGTSSAKDVKEEPEKPNELPKILCGPSPALLAKLRKKNEEAVGRPGFGKFGRKKPQKTALEKEAERMAAQFLKEEEESVSTDVAENTDPELDPFSKSVAAAKSIAIKLSGKSVLPPSGEWLAYNENKNNPNIIPPPLSPMVIRKSFTGVQNKPTPPGVSDKSPASATGTQKGPSLSADLISKAFSGEEVQLKQTKTSASPADVPTVPAPLPSPVAAPEVFNAPQMKPITPGECVITLESDVAAPGVPEEEQKHTVVIRPPPQLPSKARDPAPKTVKTKTLAAGKAKDLFDIFYSGGSAVKACVSASAGDKQDSGFLRTDSGLSSKESNSKDKKVSKEPPNNGYSSVAQREEPLRNEDSKVAQREEPRKNEDSEVAQTKESPKDEDLKATQSEEFSKNEDLKVAQSKESQKSEDLKVTQSEAAAVNEYSGFAQSEESPKNVISKVEQAFEDEILKSDVQNEYNDSKGCDIDAQQALKSIEISVGDVTVMEMNSVDTLLQTNNEEENPLDSEEPMQFSPLPGSFTEQLNLDTFEFNFEPL